MVYLNRKHSALIRNVAILKINDIPKIVEFDKHVDRHTYPIHVSYERFNSGDKKVLIRKKEVFSNIILNIKVFEFDIGK